MSEKYTGMRKISPNTSRSAGHLALGAGEVSAGMQATAERLLAMTPASEIESQVHGHYADSASSSARYWFDRARDTTASAAQRQEASAQYTANMATAAEHTQLEREGFNPANVQVSQESIDKVQRMNLR